MITVYLMGGLGNQLFQIFTTIAYALEHKHQFIFPYSEELCCGVTRPTYWKNFLGSLKFCTTDNQIYNHITHILHQLPQCKEVGFHYTKLPQIPSDQSFMLHGYFQSPKYFDSYKTSICKLMRFEETQQTIRAEFASYIDAPYVISMHFRLGDYKEKQQYHPVLVREYYERALNNILSRVSNHHIRVLYFCEAEDNEYVEATIQYLRSKINEYGDAVTFMKVSDVIDDWKQMTLMSCCNSHIIANSSYSWWGAYLCDRTDKIVCYPSKWFGPAMGHVVVDDLFPSEWTRISSQ